MRRFSITVCRAILLFVVGVAVYPIDSDLVNFILPTRKVVLILLLASTALFGVHLTLRERSGKPYFLFVLVGAAILLSALVYVREYAAYREVDLMFESEGEPLSGTLYLAREKGPHAAVVIAQGSIKAPRRLYHFWADLLVRRGIAVYSFDKRGTGRSGGTYESENNASVANLSLLATDVANAVSASGRHPEVEAARTGILGLSMGGWLGPIANMTDSVAFMALVSGPVVSVGEEGYYSELTEELSNEGSGLPQAAIDSLVLAREPSGFDPRSLLKELSIPILWPHGGADSSVPVVKSNFVIDSLVASYNKAYRHVVFPTAEHLGFVMSSPFDLAPGVVDTLTEWIDRQTRD